MKIIAQITIAIVIAYLVGYMAYRFYGPTQKTWLKGSPHSPPEVLVSLETNFNIALFNIFSPCIWIEDSIYKVMY